MEAFKFSDAICIYFLLAKLVPDICFSLDEETLPHFSLVNSVSLLLTFLLYFFCCGGSFPFEEILVCYHHLSLLGIYVFLYSLIFQYVQVVGLPFLFKIHSTQVCSHSCCIPLDLLQ